MPAPLTFIGLHYWAGSGREFQQVAGLLAPEYTLLAPDLTGFGEAAPPTIISDYSVDAYADQVAHFIAEKGIERYVLVGHSMGGKIALALAARQPSGLAGVALLSPSPPSPEPMTDEDRMASMRAYGKLAEAEKTLQKITARPLPEAIRQQILLDNMQSTRLAWDAWLLHGSREDISARMVLVEVPCTILAGDQDNVMSPSVHGLETLPLLPTGTHLEIISGAGHLLPYDAPEEVASLLRAFADKL
ncbi:Pimeloyl-ACP methyl ester carboxylesterase [Hymenobacter gelipurpurascens]|uniref:Pimeloyl-ACP methyl ester carboxylesterase n=1 Tax=Hymenobacter gelipurpurascens TaxID=89968 RepID=A0A212UE05_9BACT|nr:alpha/beta hydrolase [Hymenobacter gelipurpurascens]SNC76479.1 Pimeloyl-ACP methyl ester carboxylesterase [Hymenobacter gelipurpurascens]